MPLIATRGAASAQGFGEFAQSAAPVYIEDVFSTYLYTGNGSTQTITNGIDLSGKGGLVWIKNRNQADYDHMLYDTLRAAGAYIRSNSNGAQQTGTTYQNFTAFNSTGFSLGAASGSPDIINSNNNTFASWTFREQPKFFDVVTVTGNGASTQTINHSLGSTPAVIIYKRVSGAGAWFVYHQSIPNSFFRLNTSDVATNAGENYWNPTSTTFDATSYYGNASGETYVAYLFAHNAGGFGLTGTDNVISCGTYTGNGSFTGPVVTLGYEPQWILVKNISDTYNWQIIDNMRGMALTSGSRLFPNLADAEQVSSSLGYIAPTATGFQPVTTLADINQNGSTFIYIAIRRGPMKTPTSGTSVFNPIARNGTGSSATVSAGFPADMVLTRKRSSVQNFGLFDRLRGNFITLFTDFDGAEGSNSGSISFDTNAGFNVGSDTGGNICNQSGESYIQETFLRAPGFFDVVCYTGTGVNRTVTHNLGVVPELMIVKRRDASGDWQVYSAGIANTEYLVLNTTAAPATGATRWNSTTPTSSVFTVGTAAEVNTNTATYVAYLFATCAGVSKVGSYTGDNTNGRIIPCGFTTGARFVMIRRTDQPGQWAVWDSARGITSGNDPYLLLNNPIPEVAGFNDVETTSTGFIINAASPVGIPVNVVGSTYIFLAIA